MNYDDLIKQLADPKNSAEATQGLVQIGASAIPLIAESMRKLAAPPRLLADVLLQIRGDNIVAEFVKLTYDDDTMVQLTSIEALGHLGDLQAEKPLAQLLQDDKQLPTPKEIAATALGNLGASESTASLATEMTKAEKAKEHSLAIACAVALARLGDHSGFPVVVRCMKIKSKPVIRTLAAQALSYVTGEGMFSVLRDAIKDKYYEVRRAAVEGLYYLGTSGATELLIHAIRDRDETTANNAAVYLQRISGDEFEEPAEIQQWWKTSHKRFQPNVCYRLGLPIQLTAFADMIKDPLAKFDIVREFSIYTGRRFGADVYVRAHLDEISDQVSRLAHELAPQYEEGSVYKAGIQANLAVIMKGAK